MLWFEGEEETTPKTFSNKTNTKPDSLKTGAIKWEYKLHSAELTENRPMVNMYGWRDAAEIWLQPKQKDKNSIRPAMMMQKTNMVSH